MSLSDLGDWLLHFGGGALMAGAVLLFALATGIGWAVWLAPPVALALGALRELLQHLDDTPIWNFHRASEAAAWGLGALLVALLSS